MVKLKTFISKKRATIKREKILLDLKEIKPLKVLDNGGSENGSWDYFKTPELNITKIDQLYEDDSLNLKFEDNSFDCIVFAGVIEYLINPIKALEECYRVLKLGGYLLISTINVNSIINSLFFFKHENIAFPPKGFTKF